MVTAKIEASPVPAVYGKIAEVRKRVGKIAKNGVGPQTQGGYKFLAVDDILEVVKPLEDEVGIISYPVNHEVTFHYNTASDKNDGRVPRENVQGLVDFTYRYVAVEDGSYIDVSVPGEGIDSQDKATRKAVTQSQKIANILTYNIITGEQDPDGQDGGAEAQNAPGRPASPTSQKLDKARPAAPVADLNALKAAVRTYISESEDPEATRKEVIALSDKIKADTGKSGVELQKHLNKELGL